MRFGSIAGSLISRTAGAVLLASAGLTLAAASVAAQTTPTQTAPAQQAPAQQPSPTPAPAAQPATPAPAPAAPQTAPVTNNQGKTTYGAWTVVCGTPDGSPEKKCVLMQSVVSQERPEMQISVAISKVPGGKTGLLRVQAPLSVLLPNGLGLYIDGNDIGNAYFARCFSDGCYAEVVLEEGLLGTLRKGTTATFTVFQTQEEGIGIPVDLKGFAEGYAALP